MRRPLIAGNWKMHGSVSFVTQLIKAIKQGMVGLQDVDVLICPSFVHLNEAKSLIQDSHLLLGAQNLHTEKEGAYTGEISAQMLADLGCEYVLVGHSERRTLFHEDSTLVAQKFQAAQSAGLMPILCVGETEAQRKLGETKSIIEAQIDAVIALTGVDAFASAVIAYEPVWAIGTGLTATPQQAEEVHAFIRNFIAQNNVDIANTLRILYGGSMKPDNAAQLLAMPNIDGGLIGGASLKADSFLGICKAAANECAVAKTG